MLKKCSSKMEIEELVTDVINTFTKVAYDENAFSDYFGTKLDINPISNHIGDISFQCDKYYEAVNVWNGFIPKGMKIVYGRFYDEKYKTSSHKGCYYYLDDESYIYEFFEFLKDKDISCDFDLIIEVDHFIKKKFLKIINSKDRNDVNKLMYKDDDFYLRPVKEHSIKDFYNNGSAMCSEISVVAENLLSCFGLEVICMQDKEHMYNIYASHEDDEADIYILDYSNWVGCYDHNFKLVNTMPFFKKIDNCTAHDIDMVVNEGKRISLQDYFLYSINGSIYEVVTKDVRDYGVDFALEEEKSLILKRK